MKFLAPLGIGLLLSGIHVSAANQAKRASVTSHVTILSVDGKSKKIIYSAPQLFEAPNWSPDGKYLLKNSQGKLWRLPASSGKPELVNTGSVSGINNDHGISPDGKMFNLCGAYLHDPFRRRGALADNKENARNLMR